MAGRTRTGESPSATSRNLESLAEYYRTSEYAAFDQEHRCGGTFGLELIDVRQGAIDTADPAMPVFAFVSALGRHPGFETDYGDGFRAHRGGAHTVDVAPANQVCRLRLPAMHLRAASVPDRALARLLDETAGVGPEALAGVTGTFRSLPHAARLIDTLWHAADRPGPATNLVLDGAFLQLVGHLLAACGRPDGLAPVAPIGDARLARAIDYLETHVAEALSVGELASVATMSPSHFARSFRSATGEPVWGYVHRRRVERAHELVVHTALPLSQVAERCGFSDAGHLRRAFRTRYGRSPSEVR